MALPSSLQVMAGLGCLSDLIGLPMLVTPAFVRRVLGMGDTPQVAYVLRIVGAMLSALGLILIVFAFAYASAVPA